MAEHSRHRPSDPARWMNCPPAAQVAVYTLEPQIYGLGMAQCAFGGPSGIWLECRVCPRSARIVGAKVNDLTDVEARAVFVAGGWTGRGPNLLKAKCPECSKC